MSALIVACVAQAARDIDAGVPFEHRAGRMIEENVWRALRYGLDGKLLDLERRAEYPAAETLDRLLAWTASARMELGIEVALPALNGAQRQLRLVDEGASLREIYAATVADTRATYADVKTPAEMTQ